MSSATEPMSLSPAVATGLPIRSRALVTVEVFGTIRAEVGAPPAYADAGASRTKGKPFSRASASETKLPCPISAAPDATADATAAPLLSEVTSTSSPAFLKRPSASA